MKRVCANHSLDGLAAFHADQFVSRLYADRITKNDGRTDRPGHLLEENRPISCHACRTRAQKLRDVHDAARLVSARCPFSNNESEGAVGSGAGSATD